MVNQSIEPFYSTLSRVDIDALTQLVERVGWGETLAGLADIVTQYAKFGRDAHLSLALGVAVAKGRDVDQNYASEQPLTSQQTQPALGSLEPIPVRSIAEGVRLYCARTAERVKLNDADLFVTRVNQRRQELMLDHHELAGILGGLLLAVCEEHGYDALKLALKSMEQSAREEPGGVG
jgi:hypothetical protein